MSHSHTTVGGVLACSFAAIAGAQPFSIDWSTIEPGGTADGGVFEVRCVIGQPDAGPTMSGGNFSLTGGFVVGALDGVPRCTADMDDGTGTGTPDGGVTIDDLLYYLFVFEGGDVRSDVDDGSGSGMPDGGVTIDDLLYYLLRFESGC